ncbi:hypothetical protein [Pusillimonas minor]|uniref:Uncharacterized protein n=1 Tax=Pusillimonas minor TaxID=2697024 RepID=A0A842HMR7_9BURK|nr:hypothetical protein [Pusillimonas minor]MBC2768561.1 hypothetical protein [Pusillimonas minor]
MTTGFDERYETLGALRAKLQTRLGFISSGPGALNNRDLMNSFLQEGHDLICEEVDVKAMRRRGMIRLTKGSSKYDWVNDVLDEDIDPTRVESMWIQYGSDDPIKLEQGISEIDRAQIDFLSFPTRWDNSASQIEVWPTPDQAYDLIVWYVAPKSRFEQDADRPSVPSSLVLMYAIAMGKAHFRHPDAQAYGGMFERRLRTFKADQHENQRHFMGGSGAGKRPAQVVRSANGYRLRVG